jgi:hypothetical protein
VNLRCGADIADDVRYVGVRAHYLEIADVKILDPKIADTEENVFPCRVLRVIDDIFSTIVSLRPLNAPEGRDFSRIRLELSKREAEAIRSGDVVHVKIKPHNLMLLKN